MATFNSTTSTADILSSSVAEHFERTAATFIVPSSVTTSTATSLQLEPFVTATPHFVTSSSAAAGVAQHHHQQQQQHHHQHTNSTSSSYTFVQIKREPCQVSEVTSNNCHQQQEASSTSSATTTSTHHHHQQHHHHQHGIGAASISASATSKTMSSSTLTTLVKIEASSPKVHEMDKVPVNALSNAPALNNTSNSVPIGIAVARKRPQESSATLGSSTAIPVQQPLNKDMNCFGIRVADLGGVGAGCGNIYFTGNGDLMTSSATAEELALTAAGVQSINRTPSTFWQYPNALPFESVISMSPSTVGLQYSRDANRGQVVLLPATAAALGISNFPLYTPTDPFQQAAAFVWPSYIPQGTTTTAATLQPPPNFLFPSMSPHSTLQPQSYATSLQLFGSNYLTAAAAAAAAAAATSTLCQQHNQQTSGGSNQNGSINLSLGPGAGGAGISVSATPTIGSSTLSSSCSMSSRFLSVSTGNNGGIDLQKQQTVAQQPHQQKSMSLPPPIAPLPLVMPPASLKVEEWNAADYIAAATKSAGAQAQPPSNMVAQPPTSTTTTSTSNILQELQHAAQAQAQALNLMRLPTPPTSATMENAAAAAPQLIFQTSAAGSATPSLLNLSAADGLPRGTTVTTANFLNGGGENALTATIVGPPTPLGDEAVLNFKASALDSSSIVVGVPRSAQPTAATGPPPQMQDVNIQTDTPVCSEDENSSCPLAIQQQQQQQQQQPPLLQTAPTPPPPLPVAEQLSFATQASDSALQPLELTKAATTTTEEAMPVEASATASNECHNAADAADRVGDMSMPYVEDGQAYASNMSALEATTTCQSPQLLHETVVSHCEQSVPEDLTGLELLSNISASTLAKTVAIRVKQEPVEHIEAAMHGEEHAQPHVPLGMMNMCEPLAELPQQAPPPPPIVEPLGGLKLLCELAERIQEGGGDQIGIFASTPARICGESELLPSSSHAILSHHTVNVSATPLFTFNTQSPFRLEHQSFPSMEGIELPSTSTGGGELVVKRKKHKHSKSSKSSSASASGKKSQRCSKKSKKKYSKEKRKHKLSQLSEELMGFDDELREELSSALNRVDPNNYNRFDINWQNPQEIFDMMETDMRMRLADISRQYRKKKRKLDEISKNKKKKKCSKLAAQQQLAAAAALALSGTSGSSSTTGGLSLSVASSNGGSVLGGVSTSSPLCDYKFAKFSKPHATSSTPSSTTGTLLAPSSFIRFKTDKPTMSLAQFPPPDAATADADDDEDDEETHDAAALAIYKPVRLEPSALAGAAERGSALRLTQKQASADKISSSKKQRKRHSSNEAEVPAILVGAKQQQQQQQLKQPHPQPRRLPDPIDRELMLTNEHLYRKETRVLTDMGGLFYAGTMKPLQPPDVYAITLDGERGNKSHIMSREEIFKDTILEVAPKSVESVPVGTRLCAYWSQQYRCLYPGRAIESESSDDDNTPNDFVSVEFDDGDSGRIRLQNIRYLLSDYPIVEYNDNPLYSLGKQKKSAVKSSCGNTSDPACGASASDEHSNGALLLQQSSSLGINSNIIINNNNNNSINTSSELQSARDAYAQRSEKKRIKSLKKKSQATANALASIDAGPGTGDANDCSRKHHKHKKRKKHKKHHHRKVVASMEAQAENAFIINTSAPLATSSPTYVGKHELSMEDEHNEEEADENEESDLDETEKQVCQQTQELSAKHKATIKLETAAAVAAANAAAAAAAAVKVKTEHFDMEEETQSNMMSEISDENKGDDEVEHNNSKGSKIAAFLPERQLWGWLGKAYRKAGVKGRARKQFYKTIKRGKETITVGDCAVFLSTGRPDRPYIGHIESMWETTSSNKIVRVRWFYHPEETKGCPKLKFPGALFESPHEDENDVQTISHRCEVLPFARYFGKFGADSKQYQSIYDNNDTYYLAGYYNPKIEVIKLQEDIPTLEEQQETTTTTCTTTIADV